MEGEKENNTVVVRSFLSGGAKRKLCRYNILPTTAIGKELKKSGLACLPITMFAGRIRASEVSHGKSLCRRENNLGQVRCLIA